MVADPCRRRAAGMARSAAVAFLAADQRRFPSVWHWQTAANGVRPACDGSRWTVRCVIECAAPGVVSGGCQMEIRGGGVSVWPPWPSVAVAARPRLTRRDGGDC